MPVARTPTPPPPPEDVPLEEVPLPSLGDVKEKELEIAAQDITATSHTAGSEDREHLVNPGVQAQENSDSETATEASSDEFDWEADDETHSQNKQPLDTSLKLKRGRLLWNSFMKLAKPLRVLIIGAIGAGILITPLLVFQLRVEGSEVRTEIRVWSLWLSVTWATGIATYMVVDALPHLVIIFLRTMGHKVERLKVTIELVAAVKGWFKLALDITWMWIALSGIRAAYKPTGSYWTIINRIMQETNTSVTNLSSMVVYVLAALDPAILPKWVDGRGKSAAAFALGLLLLAEKIFLRYVAINFHRKALADRLAENRLGLLAIERLSSAHPTSNRKSPYSGTPRRGYRASMDVLGMGGWGRGRQPPAQGREAGSSGSGSPVQEKFESTQKREKGHGKTVRLYTASPERDGGRGNGNGNGNGHGKEKQANQKKSRLSLRRKSKNVTSVIVDQLGGAIGQVALKNSKLNREVEFGGLYSAGRIARKLFSQLSNVYPPREHLLVEDFYPYFRTTADAHAAFAIFDKDGNGDISKREMREAVRRIYRERKALTASLKDVGSAVAKLDWVMLGVVLVIFIFICLLVFDRSDTLASLVPMSSIILGFSFVFGHSAQLIFESLIFIFSTHVFDVGDLVMIDDQVLFVREFGLFSTTFRRVDGQEVIAPNALLSSAKIVHNLRRSNSMWESTNLMIAFDTPLEIVEVLRQRLCDYAQQHSREWSQVSVHIDKMEYQNAIHLLISMEHRPNWQDWGGRWVRRTAFMRFLKTVLEELDVRYTAPVQPVLMPRQLPPGFGGSMNLGSPKSPRSPMSPNIHLRAPSDHSLRRGSRDTLGNAGSFHGSDQMAAAASRSIRSERDRF
ncbi:hypothetical protein CERSUDRAFT_92875 [Gelatoporia subvermispora B]|uniref:EF-hand domain-containing protein n=1 Tax=Ceriporiopsis subvermispora (strain B) TaxID=914234 RepID=M2RJ47_CERS8|nr:hypothetical protein CERSUDRAFT_92875 [Gelatoporia subvermispora B]